MIVKYRIYGILALSVTHTICARTPFRKPDLHVPTLHIRWMDEHPQTAYTLTNPHLEEYPFFGIFDPVFFDQHLLPQGPISFRNHPDQSVLGTTLSNLIEELLIEIMERKRTYKHFILLQKKDFSRRGSCGLIVLKFKEYPLILKLFLETPQSFSRPTGKGVEQMFFFYMGGGINRHLTGFTRMPNVEHIQERLQQSPYWRSCVDTPRKWFWLPQCARWLHITGYGLGNKAMQEIAIPGTYAIIADAITPRRKLSLHNKEDRELALDLYNFLQSAVDPHIKNYMFEESNAQQNNAEHKNKETLLIIDTEYFPALVGLKETVYFDSYWDWYTFLIRKCGKDMFFCTKRERRQRQKALRPMLMN